MNAVSPAREVLAVKYGHRVTTRAESYLNFHLYGEPDADLDIDYYFWVIRDGGGVVLVDTGFAPEAGDRRRRAHYATPAQALPELGIAPDDVAVIVITHAHWDHTGNVRQFPRAQLVMTDAEYAFWTSSLAARAQFAAHCEPEEIALLRQARAEGRLTLFTSQHTVAQGIELTEVGCHTPGQLIASVTTQDGGTVVLASDALHFYEEVERDRPFAVLADLPGMYRAYDTLAQLATQPRTHLVAGHDPLVRSRFTRYASLPAAGAETSRASVTDLTSPRASSLAPGARHPIGA
jgi:glyoxylase-like metal-dependent hydrolase (beta-lactamase superfamily II)